MGLYSFKERFKPMIVSGEKTHTIRNVRKYPDKPGNTLHLYTGLRTKKAKLIMRVECVKVEEIEITKSFTVGTEVFEPHIWIGGHQLDASEREQLARRDGFSNFQEMLKFWQEPKNRLPFTGHIIHWRYEKEKQYEHGATRSPRSSKQRTRLGERLAARCTGRLAGQ